MRALAIALALTGCTQVKDEFVCSTDADCTTASGTTGHCESIQRCSYADTSCDTGFRYGEEAGLTADRCTTLDDCIAEVRAGVGDTCVRRGDDTVWCWGDGAAEPRQIDVPDGAIAQLDNGGAGLCVRYADGRLNCPSGSATGDIAISAREVAIGTTHSCALADDGHVACWGANDRGQLGDNSQRDRDTPANVAGLADVAQVASGFKTSLAVTNSGEVWGWGDDSQGQIGRGIAPFDFLSLVPLRADADVAFAAVAVGDLFACGLARDGAVFCWGNNDDGQNAQGSASGENDSPVLVGSLSSIVQITAGGDHACALRADGQALCWGRNGSHEATASASARLTTPEVVVDAGGTPVLLHDITAGARHTCGRTTDQGAVVCWGDNAMGQLGATGDGAHPTVVPLACR
jgi:alpha-tubulin suppressor-like RCC1 family protein